MRCRLGPATVQREPIGDHLDKQLLHHRGQVHLPTVQTNC